MRKNKLVFAFCFLTLLFAGSTTNLFAQWNTAFGKSQKLSLNAGHSTLQDALLMPDTIKGNGMALGYAFVNRSPKRESSLELSYSNSRDQIEGLTVKNHSYAITLTDGFSVLRNKQAHFLMYLGYGLQTAPSYSIATANREKYFTWSTANTISFYQSYVYWWKDQFLNLKINLPVAGIIYRPEQSVALYDRKNMNSILSSMYSSPSFASFNKYKAVDISLNYQKKITSRFDFAVQYNYGYKKIKDNFSNQSGAFGASLIYLIRS